MTSKNFNLLLKKLALDLVTWQEDKGYGLTEEHSQSVGTMFYYEKFIEYLYDKHIK